MAVADSGGTSPRETIDLPRPLVICPRLASVTLSTNRHFLSGLAREDVVVATLVRRSEAVGLALQKGCMRWLWRCIHPNAHQLQNVFTLAVNRSIGVDTTG